MGRPKRREQESLFDPELAGLPHGARWREWMGRVEAAMPENYRQHPRLTKPFRPEDIVRAVAKLLNLGEV